MDTLARKAQGKFSKFLKKLEGDVFESKEGASAGPGILTGPISERDVYRYRKQRGVNLGSWFTLERWISDAPFRSANPPGESDFDTASGPGAKEILEHHWDTWITSNDWNWLTEHGINAVRIPIGFYHVCGLDPSVLDGTSFASFGGIFEGAWLRILGAIEEAGKRGIGVLIDLHAAPGKQNSDSHSGQTGPVRFYESKNMSRTTDVLKILAKELQSKTNVIGLQLLNEPQNHGSLEAWYSKTLNVLRSVAPTLPLYIHDAWDTNHYANFAGKRPDSDFTVVDHHLYRCFTSQDHQLSGDEHASTLRSHMSNELGARSSESHGNLVIGEWSAALNPASLRSGEAGEQDRQRRVFARAELDIFEQHCAGWFFWTYKKDGWDAGWSLRDTVRAEIMPSWHGIRRQEGKEIVNDEGRKRSERDRALADHSKYWDQYGGRYEHWRFSDGFERGWDDAFAFFMSTVGTSVSEIGFRGQWAKRAIPAHVKEKGKSGNLWEFEHGVVQGIDVARRILLQA